MLDSKKVASTCWDKCSNNPCKNGGICENYFTSAQCKCSTTGFQGDRCTERKFFYVCFVRKQHIAIQDSHFLKISYFTAADSLHFEESDHLKWQESNDFNTITFRFKTIKENGVIFYTKRGKNIFSVELVKGMLRVAAGKTTDGNPICMFHNISNKSYIIRT